MDVPDDESSVCAEAPVERKHVIDAAIVRIMKSRTPFSVSCVFLAPSAFSAPGTGWNTTRSWTRSSDNALSSSHSPAQIKSQIEHLIERGNTLHAVDMSCH